jgi:uncharacterized MAPEG superfamily protein
MPELDKKQRKAKVIVIAYPIVVTIIAVILNVLVFGISAYTVTIPSTYILNILAIAAVLLVINHTWIMTATELVRVRYRMYATPEEWSESGTSKKDTPDVGVIELERVHNAHRNTTENVIYFILLSLIYIFSSPTEIGTLFWLLSFSVARLGYTYSYLTGKDNLRGVFMTLTLLAMYGLASYNLISLIL